MMTKVVDSLCNFLKKIGNLKPATPATQMLNHS